MRRPKPTQSNKPTHKQAQEPIGVIQSLTSGFDMVTRHPDMMLLPILLDTFLWLGPRLSIYPLLRASMDLSLPSVAALLGLTTPEQIKTLGDFLDQTGQASNLFWWLSPTLLGVPSLMVGAPTQKIPNGQATIWPVPSGLACFALFFVLSLIGLALSAAYWEMLSSRVREQVMSLGRIAALWWGLFKIAALFILVVLIIGFPTMLVTLIFVLFSPLAAQFVIMMGASVILWVLFYLAFTVHGVALRDAFVFQSVRMSIVLMQTQFLSAMGLIILSVGIYIGMGFVWNIPSSDSWMKAAGILGHAFTITGLLTATAFFYMDRTRPSASDQQTTVSSQ